MRREVIREVIPAKPTRPVPRTSNRSASAPPLHSNDWVLTATQAKSAEFKDWDYDPTLELDPNDHMKELDNRWRRNEKIKLKLIGGDAVSFRSSGKSLSPLILSNDLCTYEPVVALDQVKVTDVVFCQIPPKMQFHAHLVYRKEWSDQWGEFAFEIGNIKGWINGWCTLRNVYGKLVGVVR